MIGTFYPAMLIKSNFISLVDGDTKIPIEKMNTFEYHVFCTHGFQLVNQ